MQEVPTIYKSLFYIYVVRDILYSQGKLYIGCYGGEPRRYHYIVLYSNRAVNIVVLYIVISDGTSNIVN